MLSAAEKIQRKQNERGREGTRGGEGLSLERDTRTEAVVSGIKGGHRPPPPEGLLGMFPKESRILATRFGAMCVVITALDMGSDPFSL